MADIVTQTVYRLAGHETDKNITEHKDLVVWLEHRDTDTTT